MTDFNDTYDFKPQLEGFEFHNIEGSGWPDAVVVSNSRSINEGFDTRYYYPVSSRITDPNEKLSEEKKLGCKSVYLVVEIAYEFGNIKYKNIIDAYESYRDAKLAMIKRNEGLNSDSIHTYILKTNVKLCKDSQETKVNTDKWISVHDRLPEFDKSVLIYRKYGGYQDGYIAKAKLINDNDYGWEFDNSMIELDFSDTTYWMELPETPE